MTALRHILRGHGVVALLLVLFALAVRLAVPSGYMPATTSSGVAVVLCPSAGALPANVAMRGMHHDHRRGTPVTSVSDCPFAGLASPSLGGADIGSIAAPVVAAMDIARSRLARQERHRTTHLRPPPRGPPAAA